MELIDTITVQHQKSERLVMLFVGDLARLPEREAVDVLVVSAFQGNYTPTHTSLIGSLARRGISVADLAQDMEVDLRQFSSCWLSRPITRPDMHFRRILCFEPQDGAPPPEIVGDIFRSIVPFTTGRSAVSQVAMSLVASGDQMESAEVMLEALTDASLHWLSIGLPIDRIKIVLYHSVDSPLLRETFARVKQRHTEIARGAQHHAFSHDVFVSYSHENTKAVDYLVDQLKRGRPSLRVFVDRLELRPGAAWQQHIFEALDKSRKVICAFSPAYLGSKVCKDEYNMAWIRHRESADGVLLPVYLYTADLPTYMKLFQYEDVRQGDPVKISESAKRLLEHM